MMPKHGRYSAARMLVLLLSAMLLQGCATGLTATTSQAQCSGWRPITYSGKRDTKETVLQAQSHNLTGKKLGCW